MTTKLNHVCILQHRLLHYRVGFFEKLHAELLKDNIQLHLVHGQPTTNELAKKDTGSIEWADAVTNRYVSIAGRDVLWQPFPEALKSSELVIMMQENRLLSNYPWLFFRGKNKPKVAYWGHGKNFQSRQKTGFRERWKQLLINKVDWWFAYTELTRDILKESAYPNERVTVLNNAIDNIGFEQDLDAIKPVDECALKTQIKATENSKIGLFCGSLYPDKRLEYMIEAADIIHQAIPDFRLVAIGDGPSRDVIVNAARTRSWISWLGVQKGKEKAGWYKIADIVLNPGLVGLHVLDSFCAGAPMITTSDAMHSPEIAYLQHKKNGLVVEGGADKYAAEIIALFKDEALFQSLKLGALADANVYSLDNMVANFANGIRKCLNVKKIDI